jgi:hypothetical protein
MILFDSFLDELEKIGALNPVALGTAALNTGRSQVLSGGVKAVQQGAQQAAQKTPAAALTLNKLRQFQKSGGPITGKTVLGSALIRMLSKHATALSYDPKIVAKQRTIPWNPMPLTEMKKKLGTGMPGMPGIGTAAPAMGAGATKGLGMPRIGNAIHPAGGAGMGPKPPVPPTGKGGMR